MRPRSAAVGLLSGLLLFGCSLLGLGDDQQDELAKHRTLWETRELSDYRLTLEKGCFCIPWLYPATIVVLDDTVAAVLDPETGDTLRNPRTGMSALRRAPDSYRTVDGLFGVIERAIQEDYHRLSVTYDEHLGYPERIDFEISENATDDQVSYDVVQFEATANRH
jgi:hypothetical protein